MKNKFYLFVQGDQGGPGEEGSEGQRGEKVNILVDFFLLSKTSNGKNDLFFTFISFIFEYKQK